MCCCNLFHVMTTSNSLTERTWLAVLTYWYEIQKIIVITPISNIYGLEKRMKIGYYLPLLGGKPFYLVTV